MISMACLECMGKGCDSCNKSGRIDIKDCPLEMITEDVWDVMEFADLYKKGLPPVAGGALDQAKIFIDACRFIWSDQNIWKRELGISG